MFGTVVELSLPIIIGCTFCHWRKKLHLPLPASMMWKQYGRNRRLLVTISVPLVMHVGHYLKRVERKQQRAVLSNAPSDEYFPSAMLLKRNPYAGWQPPAPVSRRLQSSATGSNSNSSFSWRSCFTEEEGAVYIGWDTEKSHVLPEQCLENDLGEAPVANSNETWIPDEKMIRTMVLHGKDRDGNPFPPPLSEELCEDIGIKGNPVNDANKQCIRESQIRSAGPLDATTVTIAPNNHYGTKGDASLRIEVPAPKLMCAVYSMASAHAGRVRAIRDTWAGGCDGFLVFSNVTDPRLPAISVPHKGPESYFNMWQKVRSMWKFVGENYLNGYDWFYIAGDDVFLLPLNLKAYLASLSHGKGAGPREKGYFVGRKMHGGWQDWFNYGGPGYALSHAALQKYLGYMDDEPECYASEITQKEDLLIARCLRYLGIQVTDTRDAKARERFHPFSPGWHFHWKPDQKDQGAYYTFSKGWKTVYGGKDCCAPDSVSFHYIKQPGMMRHLQALWYSCDETGQKDKS